MGSLNLPISGVVYVDTQVLIYSIEKIAPYSDLLIPLWEASESGKLEIVTSELAIVEVLTGPLKNRDQQLVDVYEELLNGTEIQLIPIDREILLAAAKLRASTSLRTPDAIHAATASSTNCSTLLTNDLAFKAVSSLPVQILKDFFPEF